jgi:hypothetical protein
MQRSKEYELFKGIRTKNGHWNYKSAIFIGVNGSANFIGATNLLFSSGT